MPNKVCMENSRVGQRGEGFKMNGDVSYLSLSMNSSTADSYSKQQVTKSTWHNTGIDILGVG